MTTILVGTDSSAAADLAVDHAARLARDRESDLVVLLVRPHGDLRSVVMELIEQKAQHKEITGKPTQAPRATNVVDLVKVLQQSLNRNQASKPKKNGTRPPAQRSTSSMVRQKRRVAA